MTRSSRTILIALAALCALVVVAWLGVRSYLPNYDQRTRARILQQVAAEVPLGSDAGAMEAFLRKHAESYSMDDRFDHLYAGLLPQSRLDRVLGNRKVIVRLQFDSDRRFKGSEVLITYQTL
jgi:hypothetical protein